MFRFIGMVLKVIFLGPQSIVETLEQRRARWIDQYRSFQAAQHCSTHLIWAMRRMERAGFLDAPRTRLEMATWLREEKMRAVSRQIKKAEMEAKKFDRIDPTLPLVKDDSIDMLEAAANLVEMVCLPSLSDPDPGNDIPAIEQLIAESNITVKGQMRAMIVELQLSLDDIADLLCRADPKWEEAGNIIMPLYETHFELGIKHQILAHVKTFDGDAIGDQDEFRGKLEQHVYEVETRLEKARAELESKGLSDEGQEANI